MSSSGTYSFAPSVGEIVQQAYARCGVKRTEFTTEHMIDARLCSNLLLSEWANVQVHLWDVDLQTITLVAGVANYTLPPETVLLLDAYYEITDTNGTPTDRIMYPVSRSEYAAYTNKEFQAQPTVFWYDRTVIPSLTFYPTPNDSTAVVKYYRVRQIQDANPAGSQTPEVPYRFLQAYASGLAARLSEIYAPDRFDALEARHQNRFNAARMADREAVPLRISPQLGSYFRT